MLHTAPLSDNWGVGSHNGFVMRIKIRVRKYFVWLRVHVVQSSPHFDSGSSLLRVWSLSQSVYLSLTAAESKLSYQQDSEIEYYAI